MSASFDVADRSRRRHRLRDPARHCEHPHQMRVPQRLPHGQHRRDAGIHAPYRGSGPQLNDVLGGHVDLAVITATAAPPHVKAGKLAALAVAGNNRSPMLPNVPSLTESGVPGVLGDIWYGVFGPKGMAPELVARLNADFREAMRLEEKKFGANGIVVETGTPQAFGKLLAEDTERWAELIKRQGIKGDL